MTRLCVLLFICCASFIEHMVVSAFANHYSLTGDALND